MNILFSTSVVQRSELLPYYVRIIEYLRKKGHLVNDHNILDISLDEISKFSQEENKIFINNLHRWILDCDIMVVEVSFPSTMNLGYEISTAMQCNKPVIALYNKGRRSSVFAALNSDKLVYEEYTDENLEDVLKQSLEFIETKSDVRFNFYLSAKAVQFIDKLSKHKHLSRSAVLRQIIDEKMNH